MSKTYEHALRVAELIIQKQQTPQLTPTVKLPEPRRLKETPKPLSYYYKPHQYARISAGSNIIVFEFKVPPQKIFHIEQVGNNYFNDTYSNFEVDGVLIEKVERVMSSINDPFSIRHRYLHATESVRWRTYNNSKKYIVSEVVIDGVVYLEEDWNLLVGRF